jgi:hypothetical protein
MCVLFLYGRHPTVMVGHCNILEVWSALGRRLVVGIYLEENFKGISWEAILSRNQIIARCCKISI